MFVKDLFTCLSFRFKAKQSKAKQRKTFNAVWISSFILNHFETLIAVWITDEYPLHNQSNNNNWMNSRQMSLDKRVVRGRLGLKMYYFLPFFTIKLEFCQLNIQRTYNYLKICLYHSKASLFVSIKLVSLFHEAPTDVGSISSRYGSSVIYSPLN